MIQNRGSHTADCWVRGASDTAAQLKPVEQDKGWLCQACTLQSTAEMTSADESGHAGDIRLKVIADNILRPLAHLANFARFWNVSLQRRPPPKKRQKSTVHPSQLSHSRELWIHSIILHRYRENLSSMALFQL